MRSLSSLKDAIKLEEVIMVYASTTTFEPATVEVANKTMQEDNPLLTLVLNEEIILSSCNRPSKLTCPSRLGQSIEMLLRGLNLLEFYERIERFFHPLLEALNLFNKDYIGSEAAGWGFTQGFDVLQKSRDRGIREVSASLKTSRVRKLSDYMSDAFRFVHALPLEGLTLEHHTVPLAELKKGPPNLVILEQASNALTRVIDKGLVKDYLSKSSGLKIEGIMGHLTTHALLVYASLIERQHWDQWIGADLKRLLEGGQFQQKVFQIYGLSTDHYGLKRAYQKAAKRLVTLFILTEKNKVTNSS